MKIRIASLEEILEDGQKANIVCWGAGKIFSILCKRYESNCFFEKVNVLIDQRLGKNGGYYKFQGKSKRIYTLGDAAHLIQENDILLITCADFYGMLEQVVEREGFSGLQVVIYSLVKGGNILSDLFRYNQWIESYLILESIADVRKFEEGLKQLSDIYPLNYLGYIFHYYCNGKETVLPFFHMGKKGCSIRGEWFFNPLERYGDEEWLGLCREKSEEGAYWIFYLPSDDDRAKWYSDNLRGFSGVYINKGRDFVRIIIDKHPYADESRLHIFVVSHKLFPEPGQNIYKTIYVGDCPVDAETCLTDSQGDSIAELNEKINECTALYWIWKNRKDDYVGLNHYRRFFCNCIGNNEDILTGQTAMHLLEDYDILVAQKIHLVEESLYVHLKNSMQDEAYETGLHIVEQSIWKNQPDYMEDFCEVFGKKELYPCNMFITRKEICDQYCEWLFSILIEAARQIDITPYDAYSRRVIGFFAERLLTVWLNKQKLKIGELPIIMKE